MTVFLIAICIGVYANAIRIIHTDRMMTSSAKTRRKAVLLLPQENR